MLWGVIGMTRKEKKTVSILLPLEMYEQLKIYAEEDYRTIPGYIRQILKLHLQNRKTPD